LFEFDVRNGGNIPMTIIFMLILQDAVYIIFVSHLKKLSQKIISKKYLKKISKKHQYKSLKNNALY